MLLFKPIFVKKPWGASKLKNIKNYPTGINNIGEAWIISAVPNNETIIMNGEYKGKTLSYLWKNKRSLFGNYPGDQFPLLLKILDASKDLSVQVHPDDIYARVVENKHFGKSECWYFLDTKKNQEVIVGHNCNNSTEIMTKISEGKWNEFLRKIPINKGDVLDISPGTIHAILSGSLIYELQQSSDVTYRLYDYDRLVDGQYRELHVKKAIDVITFPQIIEKINKNKLKDISLPNSDVKFKKLISNNYFELIELNVDCEEIKLPKFSDKFILITSINGDTFINDTKVEKYQGCMLTNNDLQSDIYIKGEAKILIGYPK